MTGGGGLCCVLLSCVAGGGITESGAGAGAAAAGTGVQEEKYDPTPSPGEETTGARAPAEVVDGSGIVVAEVDAAVAIAGVALLVREVEVPGHPLLTARCGGTVEVDVRLEFVLLSTLWYGFGCTCGD